MSHKRQGHLITFGEWARHLRPFMKRLFWRQERSAGRCLARRESEGAGNVDILYGEGDVVMARTDMAETGLKRGDMGAVVHVHGADAVEVEFVADDGTTRAVLTLGAEAVQHAGNVPGPPHR
ncbi:MAG: DUF4926 domain-containing protein [Steroidobacteraceae bacterium]